MAESLDIFRYASYLRLRWAWIAGSGAVAVALALAVSLALPRQYTATARIVIEPPAGTDPRSAMAVSPVYLESLKTYEQFAANDSLFQKAIDQFRLRALLGARPIESLKKRVLQVALVRNTRILEIAATLPDARLAQQVARFLAESTVELSRSLETEGDRDLIGGVERQEREMRATLDGIESARARLMAEEPVADLQSAMDNAGALRGTLQQQIMNAQLEMADAGRQSGNTAARLEELRRQLAALDAESREREKLLALRMSHRDKLEAEREAAQTALTGIETRLQEARAEAGYRGERLRVIDPGVAPERPSSPNIPLNVVAALLLGLVLPVLYLTLELSYRVGREGQGR